VVLAGRGAEFAAFATILPNSGNPADRLDEFATSVKDVERRTGLLQCASLALQNSLETLVRTLGCGMSR
jgi:hypothetical protein